jgi:hypothetical protein
MYGKFATVLWSRGYWNFKTDCCCIMWVSSSIHHPRKSDVCIKKVTIFKYQSMSRIDGRHWRSDVSEFMWKWLWHKGTHTNTGLSLHSGQSYPKTGRCTVYWWGENNRHISHPAPSIKVTVALPWLQLRGWLWYRPLYWIMALWKTKYKRPMKRRTKLNMLTKRRKVICDVNSFHTARIKKRIDEKLKSGGNDV